MVVSVSASKAAALANGFGKVLARSHRRCHPSRCRWLPLATAHPSVAHTITNNNNAQRNCFGSTTITQASADNNSKGDTHPHPSPGQASITLQGGWTDTDDDDDKIQTETPAPPLDTSVFSIPVVLEMPCVDDHDESYVEKWHKQPGDFLQKEDVLCEIATPDFVFGMQIDDDDVGILGAIHAPEGMHVPSQTPLCTIYHQAPPPSAPEE